MPADEVGDDRCSVPTRRGGSHLLPSLEAVIDQDMRFLRRADESLARCFACQLLLQSCETFAPGALHFGAGNGNMR
jgi:hypothetical protein